MYILHYMWHTEDTFHIHCRKWWCVHLSHTALPSTIPICIKILKHSNPITFYYKLFSKENIKYKKFSILKGIRAFLVNYIRLGIHKTHTHRAYMQYNNKNIASITFYIIRRRTTMMSVENGKIYIVWHFAAACVLVWLVAVRRRYSYGAQNGTLYVKWAFTCASYCVTDMRLWRSIRATARAIKCKIAWQRWGNV